ncbi:hypothetical protein K5X82_04710 [Halosquirtibacter xylanolyticus]|uniref:hypothetical protein n=1 Tax=Halosquirtibacter xylanolyticus TaxID=3374599 RepID=UPI00374882B1|nr:hypothetical protein K5X82_04710 [Prolixibacteraceae bacterium]
MSKNMPEDINPKFLIGVDPKSNIENDYDILFHNHFPFFSTKIYPISIQELSEKEVPMSTYMAYINGEGDLEIFRIQLMSFDKHKELGDYIENLKQVEAWYGDYLAYLDEREFGHPGVLIKDFSSELSGLKIIKDPEGLMVLGHQLVVTFENEDDMDAFLEQELEISANLLDQGVINIFE